MAGIKIFGSSTGQKIPILKVVNHPDFSQDWFNNIAIVKLAKPLRFNSNVQQACLPDNSFEPKPNSGAWVSGWSGLNGTAALKFAFVKIISKDQFQCNVTKPTPNMICAIDSGNGDACYDLGNSLIGRDSFFQTKYFQQDQTQLWSLNAAKLVGYIMFKMELQ